MTEIQIAKRIRKAYEELAQALDDARDAGLTVRLPRIDPDDTSSIRDGKIVRRAVQIDKAL